MIFGFDLDGTITAEPGIFRTLMESLMRCDHRVFIISAFFDPNTAEAQQKKIDDLWIVKGKHYTDALFVDGGDYGPEGLAKAGVLKRDFCSVLGISLFVDDKPEFVEAISQSCRCLLVGKR